MPYNPTKKEDKKEETKKAESPNILLEQNNNRLAAITQMARQAAQPAKQEETKKVDETKKVETAKQPTSETKKAETGSSIVSDQNANRAATITQQAKQEESKKEDAKKDEKGESKKAETSSQSTNKTKAATPTATKTDTKGKWNPNNTNYNWNDDGQQTFFNMGGGAGPQQQFGVLDLQIGKMPTQSEMRNSLNRDMYNPKTFNNLYEISGSNNTSKTNRMMTPMMEQYEGQKVAEERITPKTLDFKPVQEPVKEKTPVVTTPGAVEPTKKKDEDDKKEEEKKKEPEVKDSKWGDRWKGAIGGLFGILSNIGKYGNPNFKTNYDDMIAMRDKLKEMKLQQDHETEMQKKSIASQEKIAGMYSGTKAAYLDIARRNAQRADDRMINDIVEKSAPIASVKERLNKLRDMAKVKTVAEKIKLYGTDNNFNNVKNTLAAEITHTLAATTFTDDFVKRINEMLPSALDFNDKNIDSKIDALIAMVDSRDPMSHSAVKIREAMGGHVGTNEQLAQVAAANNTQQPTAQPTQQPTTKEPTYWYTNPTTKERRPLSKKEFALFVENNQKGVSIE